MAEDLMEAGLNPKKFKETKTDIFFNIKFKIKDLRYYDFGKLISDEDINIKSFRYNLLTKKSEFILNPDDIENTEPVIYPEAENLGVEGKEKSTDLRIRTIDKTIAYDPLHDKIQSILKRLLKKEYQTVLYENNRVDLKAKADNNSWHFFEVKTDEPLLSIRKALSQLLEYAYFPNKEKASRIIVVSIYEPDIQVRQYLQTVRIRFRIPIYYRYFRIDNNTISKEY